MRDLAAAVVALVALGACASAGDGSGATTTVAEQVAPACAVLELDEVEGFVGEPVHPPETSDVAPGVSDTTCFWADADPGAPGHLLSVTLSPTGEVSRPEPAATDQVYDLSDNDVLGEDAFGAQRAAGGARVVFSAADRWVDVVYEVLPSRFMEDDAIDRLVRLAERIAARLGTRA